MGGGEKLTGDTWKKFLKKDNSKDKKGRKKEDKRKKNSKNVKYTHRSAHTLLY
jgi:hypothetical protein